MNTRCLTLAASLALLASCGELSRITPSPAVADQAALAKPAANDTVARADQVAGLARAHLGAEAGR